MFIIFSLYAVCCCQAAQITVITEGIRYSESVLPWNGGLLISNFGSENRAPREDENKGYILYYKDGKMTTLIPPDGRLHLPTGMAVKDGFLFVCNMEKVMVYNLEAPGDEPGAIHFAADDQVANAIALDGNDLYVTVTNTGRIYKVDVSVPETPGRPEIWLENVPGPNGLTIGGNTMYIATIPADYATVKPDNLVYRVTDVKRPVLEPFINEPGLYDGVALSPDNKTLYVSDWKTASVIAIDIETRKSRIIYHESGIGPADIAIGNGNLYIPDLLNSRVIVLPLDEM